VRLERRRPYVARVPCRSRRPKAFVVRHAAGFRNAPGHRGENVDGLGERPGDVLVGRQCFTHLAQLALVEHAQLTFPQVEQRGRPHHAGSGGRRRCRRQIRHVRDLFELPEGLGEAVEAALGNERVGRGQATAGVDRDGGDRR
jgi:hypothetical protein